MHQDNRVQEAINAAERMSEKAQRKMSSNNHHIYSPECEENEILATSIVQDDVHD